MTPGTILTEPERTNEFKQGYQEGFEAGKACLRQELKGLLKSLSDKEVFVTASATHINPYVHYQH